MLCAGAGKNRQSACLPACLWLTRSTSHSLGFKPRNARTPPRPAESVSHVSRLEGFSFPSLSLSHTVHIAVRRSTLLLPFESHLGRQHRCYNSCPKTPISFLRNPACAPSPPSLLSCSVLCPIRATQITASMIWVSQLESVTLHCPTSADASDLAGHSNRNTIE